jgi:hypothetical protein
MTRQTGLIITIVAAVIFGCCAISSCVGSIITFAGGSTYTLGMDAGQMPQWTGIFGICFSIFFVAIPVALWYFLVRGKTDEPEAAAAPPPAAPPAAGE